MGMTAASSTIFDVESANQVNLASLALSSGRMLIFYFSLGAIMRNIH
jgi:hypothetical protein